MTPRAPHPNPWAERAYILGTLIRLDLLRLRLRWLNNRRDLAYFRARRAVVEFRRLAHACMDEESKIEATEAALLGDDAAPPPEGRQ